MPPANFVIRFFYFTEGLFTRNRDEGVEFAFEPIQPRRAGESGPWIQLVQPALESRRLPVQPRGAGEAVGGDRWKAGGTD